MHSWCHPLILFRVTSNLIRISWSVNPRKTICRIWRFSHPVDADDELAFDANTPSVHDLIYIFNYSAQSLSDLISSFDKIP